MSVSVLLKAIAVTGQVSVPTVIDAVAGRGSMEVYDRRLDGWSRALLRHAAIELDVRGLEHLRPGEAYVVMSNHQSHYDIPVVFQALGLRVRMVTKAELFRVPIWGGAMRQAGFVEVDRGNRAQALAALGGAREAIRQGTSIWIAPEGTRSRTGELGPFKKGGFHLAFDSGARILPITIDGTRRVLPAGGRRVRPGATVRVVVSPPIDPAAYGPERRDELMAAVRAAIARPLGAS